MQRAKIVDSVYYEAFSDFMRFLMGSVHLNGGLQMRLLGLGMVIAVTQLVILLMEFIAEIVARKSTVSTRGECA